MEIKQHIVTSYFVTETLHSSLLRCQAAHSSHILHWRVLGFSDHSGGTSDSALKHTSTSDPFLEVVHRYNLSHFKP